MRSQRSLRAPAAGGAGDRGLDAQGAQQVERVREPEGDALEHGAHDVAARVARAQADERAARVRVGVRRALAREVGQEEDAAGARGRRLGLGHQLSNGTPGANVSRAHCSEPAADSITPIACQLRRHRMAEDVHARLRVGLVGGQRGEDDARGAEHERDRARAAPRRRRARPRRSRPRRPRPARRRRCGRRSRATRARAASRPPGTSSASRTAVEKRRSATSKSSVPEASATSIARSPQSRSRT